MANKKERDKCNREKLEKMMAEYIRYALDFYQKAKSGQPEKMVNYEERMVRLRNDYKNKIEIFEEVFTKEQEKRGIFVSN